jgi:hypothetical protein
MVLLNSVYSLDSRDDENQILILVSQLSYHGINLGNMLQTMSSLSTPLDAS